jgi:hypothetical protein
MQQNGGRSVMDALQHGKNSDISPHVHRQKLLQVNSALTKPISALSDPLGRDAAHCANREQLGL